MAIELLDALTIKAIKGPKPGKTVTRHNDGGGLWLRVTKHKSNCGEERVSKSWEFYFAFNRKTCCTGLGPFAAKERAPGLTLNAARDKAHEYRKLVANGFSPIEVKRQQEAERIAAKAEAERLLQVEAARAKTFADAVEDYLEIKDAELTNDRHRQTWRSSLYSYALPVIGQMSVEEIEMKDILRVLNQSIEDKSGKALGTLFEARNETALRLRNRIEAVLSWATVAGYRTGDNPARWAGNLKLMFPKPSTYARKGNQPALAVSDMPTWFEALGKREGMGAKALKFAVLCANRSGEVRGMTWDEVRDLDGDKPMWVIAKDRTKTETEYRIPLSPDAVDLLKSMPRMTGTNLVFFAPRGGQLSDMTISKVMKTMHQAKLKEDGTGWIDPNSKRAAVPHGTCRSTFRQWCAEAAIERDLAEMALGHKVGNEVERAYQHSDMIERRRALASTWAAFCRGKTVTDNVVQLRAGGA